MRVVLCFRFRFFAGRDDLFRAFLGLVGRGLCAFLSAVCSGVSAFLRLVIGRVRATLRVVIHLLRAGFRGVSSVLRRVFGVGSGILHVLARAIILREDSTPAPHSIAEASNTLRVFEFFIFLQDSPVTSRVVPKSRKYLRSRKIVTQSSMSVPTPAIAAASVSSPTSSRALRGYAWGVLGYNVAVILWGAADRATGSGAGCGEHWPLCNGSVIQQHPTVATLIEYAHRATSGIALIAVIALVFWAFSGTVKRHLARVAAIAALIFTLDEALLGALLVLLGKTAQDQSISRAVYLALHLTNTLLMLAALTLTAHFLSRKRGYMRGSIEIRGAGLASAGLIAVILTGVTGALAALADTLHPSTNLLAALAQIFPAIAVGLFAFAGRIPSSA